MDNNTKQFFALINSPIKFRLFMFSKLPSAFFCGVKVKYADEHTCIATVPYKWFTQNPFKSTYFACQAMAAELSTGILAMANIYKKNPGVSMLVLNLKAEFIKKATGVTFFTCDDGQLIYQTVQEALQSGEAKTVTALATGRNKNNEVIARFEVTWSFKKKADKY